MALTHIHNIKEGFLGWTDGFHATVRQIIKVEWPTNAESTQSHTASTNTFTASAPSWLASVVGAFDDNPLYPQIVENEREARRRMDEQFIILE